MIEDEQGMIPRYVQCGGSAELDRMRHDINVQRHVPGRIDVHCRVLAGRDRGLQIAFVGNPVGIAEMVRADDIFALHAPAAAGGDNGLDITMEEFEIIVFQLRHISPAVLDPVHRTGPFV